MTKKAEQRQISEEEITVEEMEEIRKAVKEKNDKDIIADHTLTDDQQKVFQQMLEDAKMPVEMTDENFKLGEKELDIRKLSSENQIQMVFRSLVLNNVYLKQVVETLIDITRLQYAQLKTMGLSGDNLVDAVDLTLYDIRKTVEKRVGKNTQDKKA